MTKQAITVSNIDSTLIDNHVDALMEVKIWEDYINTFNKQYDIQTGILILNNVAGYCRPRRYKTTWRIYKDLLIQTFPWQAPFLPDKLQPSKL